MTTQIKTHTKKSGKKTVNGKREASKMANFFVKWGRGKREANNVNCKQMIFVIRNLVDVDDVSPATALEIPFDVCLNYVGIFPKRKG